MSEQSRTFAYLFDNQGLEVTTRALAEHLMITKPAASRLLSFACREEGVYRVDRGVYIYNPDRKEKMFVPMREKVENLLNQNNGMMSFDELKDTLGIDSRHLSSMLHKMSRTYKYKIKTERCVILG